MAEPGSKDSPKDLVEYIAKALVDHPEKVKVSEVQGDKTSVIELTVAKEDLGKVIGKRGRTAQAIRTILNNASMKIRKRSVLEIIEWNILLPCILVQDCLLGKSTGVDKGGYCQSGRKTNADLRVSLRGLQAHYFRDTDPCRA